MDQNEVAGEILKAVKREAPITPEDRAEARRELFARAAAGDTVVIERNTGASYGSVLDYYSGKKHIGYLERGDVYVWDVYKSPDVAGESSTILNEEPLEDYDQALALLERVANQE